MGELLSGDPWRDGVAAGAVIGFVFGWLAFCVAPMLLRMSEDGRFRRGALRRWRYRRAQRLLMRSYGIGEPSKRPMRPAGQTGAQASGVEDRGKDPPGGWSRTNWG